MTRKRPHAPGRRAFLAGLGASVAATPFIPLLTTTAGTGEIPKRLILVFSPNGTIRENWSPQGTETDFQLSTILAPLEPHKSDLVIVEGLNIPDAGPGDGHQRGMASLWSGHTILNGNEFEGGNGEQVGWGGGITVDQRVAQAVGQACPFGSLEFAAHPTGNSIWTRMCYGGPNAPIPPEDDPAAMFDRLFAEFGLAEDEFQRLRDNRQSVVDAVRGDLMAVEGKVASEDRIKIEAHLEAVSAIEKRIQAPPWGEACSPPLIPAVDHNSNDAFPEVVDLQTQLLVMSMACGLTNVASLQWNCSVGGVRFNWLGITEGHHSLSHLGDEDPTMIDQITAVNVWYAERFAELIAALKAVPEGDGTMLDNTLIVWGNELGRGNSHSRKAIPFVLAGGAGGAIQTGRHLKYDGLDHSRLLVSICNAMGLPEVQTFGDLDSGSGPLPGLLS